MLWCCHLPDPYSTARLTTARDAKLGYRFILLAFFAASASPGKALFQVGTTSDSQIRFRNRRLHNG